MVEPLSELNRIQIQDNGEPLVDALSILKKVEINRDSEYVKDTPYRFYGRITMIEMLQKVQNALPKGYKLRLTSMYRSIAEQTHWYNKVTEDLAKEHPHWPRNILRREANRWIHPPDVKTPPGHSTGGAVDLSIVGRDGEPLDMTSPFEPDGKNADKWAPTFSSSISDAAKKNRELLINVMSEVGFTNYGGEYWHWSYGDSCWAWRQRRKIAIYGAIEPLE